MSKAHGIYVDPRSDRVAINLGAAGIEDIAGKRIRHGMGHYEARDAVLREYSGAWVEHAGKETADKTVRLLHFLSPDECLTERERSILQDRERVQGRQVLAAGKLREAEYAAYLRRLAPDLADEIFPTRGRVASAAPWAIAVFLLALMMALVFVAPSYAGEPSPRWKALAACGVTKMDSPDYERKCRAFSRTERTVVREYDGPGAGAPRDWEVPRSYD